jgi:hypothetical protein
MGIMAHAREGISGDGRFLNKAYLVSTRIPLGITGCRYEPSGTAKYPNPRWVISVVAWVQGQPLPELEGGDTGKVSMNAGAMRDQMFQKLTTMLNSSSGPLGPVMMVQQRSPKGQAFYSFEDYTDPMPLAPQPMAAPLPQPYPVQAPPPPVQPAWTPVQTTPLPFNQPTPSVAPQPVAANPQMASLVHQPCGQTVTGFPEFVESAQKYGISHTCPQTGPCYVFFQ